jgi:hypothetical protein
VGAARTVTTGLGVRALRGMSGVLAGGLVALAVAVCAAQWLASTSGRPGPGTATVAWHVSAALVTVALQLAADRLRGQVAVLAAGSVLMIAAGVLWFGWYS